MTYCSDALFSSVLMLCSLLFQGYDNQESSVRKASVFALVALNAIIGEDLKPYLLELNGSKVCIESKRTFLLY